MKEIISNNITILIVIKVCHLLIQGSLDEVDMRSSRMTKFLYRGLIKES